MSKGAAVTLALGFVFVGLLGRCFGAASPLQVGFYEGKCKGVDVEATVGRVVRTWFFKDPTITAALLRMHFHDCFVKGCDASILLDGSNVEKTAVPNLSVRGYDLIDAVKAAVEAICPGVVSCADIIAMATRDAVSMSGGGRYPVETGRRDGTVSLANLVNVPPPFISVSDSIKAFQQKGLNAADMAYLLGGHTVGVAHCSLFKDRLYNFQNSGKPDKTMSPLLLFFLRIKCPQNATVDNTANLDQNPLSSLVVDNSYYKQIKANRGILQIDQELALDPLTKDIVTAIATRFDFSTKFGQAMVKMGAVEVLTGNQGEIRSSCRAVNKKGNGDEQQQNNDNNGNQGNGDEQQQSNDNSDEQQQNNDNNGNQGNGDEQQQNNDNNGNQGNGMKNDDNGNKGKGKNNKKRGGRN